MKRLQVLLCVLSIVLLTPLSGQADQEFYGIIESRPEGKVGSWMIGGRQIVVTESTQLKEEHGPLAIGACAEVEEEDKMIEEIESEKKAKCQK